MSTEAETIPPTSTTSTTYATTSTKSEEKLGGDDVVDSRRFSYIDGNASGMGSIPSGSGSGSGSGSDALFCRSYSALSSAKTYYDNNGYFSGVYTMTPLDGVRAGVGECDITYTYKPVVVGGDDVVDSRRFSYIDGNVSGMGSIPLQNVD